MLVKDSHTLIISPLVIDELIYIILRNLKIVGKLSDSHNLPLVRQSLAHLLKLSRLTLVNPPTEISQQIKVLTLMEKFKLKPRDAYHLLTIKHHKIGYFATLDHDFDLVFQHTRLKPFPQTLEAA